MGWPLQVFLFVLSLAVSAAMRKDPERGKAPSLDDFQIPTAEDGKIIPVLFGTREIAAYNVVWHGDLVSESYNQRDNSKVNFYSPELGFANGRGRTTPQARIARLRLEQIKREAALGLS
jgi:hypothetical protein